MDFNPRSSCEERLEYVDYMDKKALFQSTLLMRGATGRSGASHRPDADFNPRSSCEERRDAGGNDSCLRNFNPRSSCEERRWRALISTRWWNFNPRSSCEERLRAGTTEPISQTDFNPRSSCEERHEPFGNEAKAGLFQSTLLMRGATVN